MLFAKASLVLLDLLLKLDKCLARTGRRIRTCGRGMQRAGRERQVGGKSELGTVGMLFKPSMELHEVRLVTLQQFFDLSRMMVQRRFNSLRRFDMPIADADLHGGTHVGVSERTADSI